MAEVEGEWTWLVYCCCSHFFGRKRSKFDAKQCYLFNCRNYTNFNSQSQNRFEVIVKFCFFCFAEL